MRGTSALGTLIHYVIHYIAYLVFLIFIIWLVLYWITWNQGKAMVARAQSDITENIWDNGKISQEYVLNSIEKYCTNSAYESDKMEIVEVYPGFDSEPAYLGQPMYVEFKVVYHILNVDIPITGRSDIGNARIYGKGFNTEHTI